MESKKFNESSEIKVTDKAIFTDIWIAPWRILRYVHQNKYDKFLYFLLFAAGISRALDRAVNKDMGDTMSLGAILGISIIVGGLLGWISYYIYAALASWTGGWLGGEGKTNDLLRIFAYAAIPNVLALLLLAIQIIIYGIEIFKADGDIFSASLISNIIFYTLLLFEFVLAIYSIVFTVIGVAIVQNFGILKAILNLMLPVLIFGIPILVIALLVGAFNY